MSGSALVSVIDQIETLSTNELRQVGAIIQKRLARQNEISAREAFYQALVMQGLVKTINPTSGQASKPLPIVVQGKPVSETIIEDRR